MYISLLEVRSGTQELLVCISGVPEVAAVPSQSCSTHTCLSKCTVQGAWVEYFVDVCHLSYSFTFYAADRLGTYFLNGSQFLNKLGTS